MTAGITSGAPTWHAILGSQRTTRSDADGRDEDAVRQHVRDLLDWAGQELDLLSTAFQGCSDADLERLCEAQGVRGLPAAYDEFLRCMGHGGVGSAAAEVFPADDVVWDALVPSPDWPGVRHLARQVARDRGFDVPFDADHVVIRLHRDVEVEYVPVGVSDPPVFAFTRDGMAPHRKHGTLTAWLEWRIGRAIKRRFPLRDAFYPG
ncbi:MAG: hypothetical protein MUF83_11220 [Acidimicrobiales bacterium]|jgi:hypothetical protein|nr:hypothetical protein [Acidimicrobiales bacterium]